MQTTLEPGELTAVGGKLTAREVNALNEQFATVLSEDVLAWAWERFGARAAIGTSFQGSGLVMMHLAKRAGLPFPVWKCPKTACGSLGAEKKSTSAWQ